jgi:hypothetical protein
MTKITIDRAVVEQALHVATGAGYPVALIAALRAALAEPCPCGDRPAAQCPGEWEPGCDLGNNPKYARRVNLQEPVQEPVAWLHTDPDKPRVKFLEWREDEPGYRGRWIKTPLYTAAPPQRPAEPVEDTSVKLKPVFYAPRRLDGEEIEAIIKRNAAITESILDIDRKEPPCSTRECMPSECPNCVSLQDQNTELDRKLADLEQTSLELCNVCGWKTLIPGDCCLNCERKHPLGQASTDVPLTVYVVKKAEPVQEPVAKVELMTTGWNPGLATRIVEIDDHFRGRLRPGQLLYTAPPQRKPLTKASLLYIYNQLPNWGMDMDRLPQGLEKFARAVEAAHGIKEGT